VHSKLLVKDTKDQVQNKQQQELGAGTKGKGG